MADRFEQLMVFPFEGDSAQVTLSYHGEQWAGLLLEGIDLRAVGKQRTANAHGVVYLDLPWRRLKREKTWRFNFADAKTHLERAASSKQWWGFDVAEALDELQRAYVSLLENEHDREPLIDPQDLTGVEAALSKMSRQRQAVALEKLAGHNSSAETGSPAQDEQQEPPNH